MDTNHFPKIQDHFNSEYTDYDVCCNRVVPRNDELQKILVQSIPHERAADLKMLDLGIGTGLTAWHVLNEFPKSHVDGIDFSSEMLKQTHKRMGRFNSRVKLIEEDFTKYEFKDKYDVIFSAMTIHNVPDNEKKELFSKLYTILNKNGVLVVADFIKFKSSCLTNVIMDFYEDFLCKNLTGKELEHWLRHAKKEDLPSTLDEQFTWLREAGFSQMECTWMYQNLAVFYAMK